MSPCTSLSKWDSWAFEALKSKLWLKRLILFLPLWAILCNVVPSWVFTCLQAEQYDSFMYHARSKFVVWLLRLCFCLSSSVNETLMKVQIWENFLEQSSVVRLEWFRTCEIKLRHLNMWCVVSSQPPVIEPRYPTFFLDIWVQTWLLNQLCIFRDKTEEFQKDGILQMLKYFTMHNFEWQTRDTSNHWGFLSGRWSWSSRRHDLPLFWDKNTKTWKCCCCLSFWHHKWLAMSSKLRVWVDFFVRGRNVCVTFSRDLEKMTFSPINFGRKQSKMLDTWGVSMLERKEQKERISVWQKIIYGQNVRESQLCELTLGTLCKLKSDPLPKRYAARMGMVNAGFDSVTCHCGKFRPCHKKGKLAWKAFACFVWPGTFPTESCQGKIDPNLR